MSGSRARAGVRSWLRPERPDLALPAGERVLAWSRAADGTVVAGTRDALYLSPPRTPDGRAAEPVRIAWEDVEAADWDRDADLLHVSEVGSWGEARPEHRIVLERPGLLLELVRERVTASVVLQRHVPVRGRRGVRVIARRAPRGDQPLRWLFEYDAGVDPDDPEVRLVASEALDAAREELGER